ncbi:hypothetical protein AAOE16_16350 [Ekhidna sp. MALMAid0563]|uniref:hypothetical protein n=1 Tax=Ekhidna sp. MALMAid0563 TaxID=3143937 RepID=UPI0032DED243
MTELKIKKAIKKIPLGSKLQLVKSNGDTIEVQLMSHEVSGTDAKDYGQIVVPALPPAITVKGGSRFGNFRIEIVEISELTQVK